MRTIASLLPQGARGQSMTSWSSAGGWAWSLLRGVVCTNSTLLSGTLQSQSAPPLCLSIRPCLSQTPSCLSGYQRTEGPIPRPLCWELPWNVDRTSIKTYRRNMCCSSFYQFKNTITCLLMKLFTKSTVETGFFNTSMFSRKNGDWNYKSNCSAMLINYLPTNIENMKLSRDFVIIRLCNISDIEIEARMTAKLASWLRYQIYSTCTPIVTRSPWQHFQLVRMQSCDFWWESCFVLVAQPTRTSSFGSSSLRSLPLYSLKASQTTD